MKNTTWISLLMVAGLMACSSDDEIAPQVAPRPMVVDIAEQPVMDTSEADSRQASQRAAVTTTATLSSFSMNYQDSKYTFTKNGTWSENNWPDVGNNDKIDFYAYSAGTFNYNGGSPYVSFTVDENAFSQHDLLVAEHKQIAYNDAGGHVSLTFDHACAVVLFNVKITNTLHAQIGDLTVNSIILRNMKNTGDYAYDTSSWSNVSGTAYYTLTNSDLTVSTTYQQLPCDYLFMIPQSHDVAYLEVNYTFLGQTKTQVLLPLSIDWQAGRLYTINVKLGTGSIK